MWNKPFLIWCVIVALGLVTSGCVTIASSASDTTTNRESEVKLQTNRVPVEVLWISGVLEQGGKVGRLSPVFRLQSPVVEGAGKGEYSVELVDAKGVILKGYAFNPTPLIAQGRTSQSSSGTFGFSFNLPAMEGVAAIRLKHGADILHELKPGPQAPQIRNLLATGLERGVAGRTLKLTWVASDADGDSVSYMVRYSPDGGKTWRPVGVNLPQPNVNLDMSQFGGTQQGMIQVLASDGVNTTTATTSPFVIQQGRPSLSIIAPAEGAVIQSGYPLILMGGAQDPEDGTLPDESLVWTSDISGLLGRGQTVQVEKKVPIGTHVITLTAKDKDGNEASQSVTVQIR